MTHSEIEILVLTSLLVFFILAGALGYLLFRDNEKRLHALEDTLSHLRHSETHYKSLVETAQVLLLVHTESAIVFCNPAGLSLLGKTDAAHVVGTSLAEWVADTERSAVQAFIKALCCGSLAADAIEVTLTKPDQTHTKLLLHGTPILYDGKPAVAITGKEILRSAEPPPSEVIPVLASAVAYNFNDVFATIETILHQLRQNGLRATHSELEVLEQALTQGRRLTQSILDFTHPVRTEFSTVSLWSIVEAARQLLETSLGNYLSFKLTLDASSDKISADATLIRQLILNLVVSLKSLQPSCRKIAIDIAEPSPESLRSLLHHECSQRYLLLRIGPASELPRLSLQLLKIGDLAEQEAVSVRLLLVYHIVMLHSGILTTQKDVAGQLAFAALLPKAEAVEPVPSPTPSSSPSPFELPSCTEHSCQKKILIVDDETHLCEILSRALSSAGYLTLTAQSSKSAIQILQERNYDIDLCIFDLSLPEMNGEELFRFVHQAAPHLPVLITSGSIEPARQQQMLQNGVVNFLIKPFSLKTLLNTVQAVLAD